MTPNRTRTLSALGAASLAFVLAQTTVIPAMPEIQADFGSSADWVAWVLTAYLLVGCAATPILGRLGDMLGKRRLLAISLACFSAGSFVCAVAPSLGLMVSGRALQGLGGGVFPLAFAIVREQFPARAVPRGIALLGAISTIGGGVGLPIGGLLVDGLGYRSLFWVGAAMGLSATIATLAFVPRSPIGERGRVDVAGAVLLSVGLALLLLGISRSAAWGGTSPTTLGLLTGGVAVLVLLGTVERGRTAPLVDVRTLARRPVLLTNVATFFAGASMVGAFVLVPQLGQFPRGDGAGLGLSTTQAGLLLIPGSVLSMIAAPIVGRVCGRFGSRLPLLGGCTVVAVALLAISVARDSVVLVVVWAALMSTGLGCVFGAIPNLLVQAVPPHQTGEATGTNTLMRNLGMAIGAQVTGSVLAGHALADGRPTGEGLTIAFAIVAGGAVLGALAAALAPAERDRPATPEEPTSRRPRGTASRSRPAPRGRTIA